jgi:hypothetical protein
MDADTWQAALVAALVVNAALGFGYRVFRLTKGGPLADAAGQALLGVVLVVLAAGAAAGSSWARWGALAYGLLFGLVVMPVWTLAVLIPQRPGPLDVGFAVAYWVALAVVVVAAIAL